MFTQFPFLSFVVVVLVLVMFTRSHLFPLLSFCCRSICSRHVTYFHVSHLTFLLSFCSSHVQTFLHVSLLRFCYRSVLVMFTHFHLFPFWKFCYRSGSRHVHTFSPVSLLKFCYNSGSRHVHTFPPVSLLKVPTRHCCMTGGQNTQLLWEQTEFDITVRHWFLSDTTHCPMVTSREGEYQRKQHSLSKAVVEHDRAGSPHGWVTVSCKALGADGGWFCPSQNSVQSLYPTKVLRIRV